MLAKTKDKDRSIEKYGMKPVIPVLLMGILFFLYLQQAGPTPDGDDALYRESIRSYETVAAWIKSFYHGWSGRIPTHLVLILFLYLPTVIWRLCTAAAGAALIWLCFRYALFFHGDGKLRHKTLCWACICLLPLLLPEALRVTSIDWVTGSFNYLYPALGLLTALYVFLKVWEGKKIRKSGLLCAAAGGWYCCFSEQTGILFIMLGAVVLTAAWLRHHKAKRDFHKEMTPAIVIYLIGAACFLTAMLAPGNQVRFYMEYKQFSAYEVFNIFDKIALGLRGFQYYHYYYFRFVHMLVLNVLLILVFVRRGRKKELLLSIPALLIQLFLVFYTGKSADYNYINLFDDKYLLWLIIILASFCMNTCLIYRSFDNRDKGIFAAALYIGAIISGVAVCFSNTLYASGLRTQLVTWILFLLLSGVLVMRILSTDKAQTVSVQHAGGSVQGRVNLFFAGFPSLACLTYVAILYAASLFIPQKSVNDYQHSTSILAEITDVSKVKGYYAIEAGILDRESVYQFKNWESEVAGTAYYMDGSLGILDQETGIIYPCKTYARTVVLPYPPEVTLVETISYIPRDRLPETGIGSDRLRIVVLMENLDGEKSYGVPEQKTLPGL